MQEKQWRIKDFAKGEFVLDKDMETLNASESGTLLPPQKKMKFFAEMLHS